MTDNVNVAFTAKDEDAKDLHLGPEFEPKVATALMICEAHTLLEAKLQKGDVSDDVQRCENAIYHIRNAFRPSLPNSVYTSGKLQPSPHPFPSIVWESISTPNSIFRKTLAYTERFSRVREVENTQAIRERLDRQPGLHPFEKAQLVNLLPGNVRKTIPPRPPQNTHTTLKAHKEFLRMS